MRSTCSFDIMCIQELCMCVCAIHFLKRSRLMTQACTVCNSNKVIHMCCCCCFGGSSNSFSDNQIHDSMNIYSTTHRRHTYIIIVNIDDNYMGEQQNPYQHTHTCTHMNISSVILRNSCNTSKGQQYYWELWKPIKLTILPELRG